MFDKNSCFPVCNQHQLRPFIECKTVVLTGLSFDFFEQVIVKPSLGPNSNTPEDLCYVNTPENFKNVPLFTFSR